MDEEKIICKINNCLLTSLEKTGFKTGLKSLKLQVLSYRKHLPLNSYMKLHSFCNYKQL